MRIMPWLSILILLAAPEAWAQVIISQVRQDDIWHLVKTAQASSAEIKKKGAIIARIKKSDAGYPSGYFEFATRYATLKRDRNILLNEAIARVLVAYGITEGENYRKPILPGGFSVMKATKDGYIYWHVTYGDNGTRELLDNGEVVFKIPPQVDSNGLPPRNGGVTHPDGLTTIHGNFKSLGELVLLLYHERVHFKQFTTMGMGDIYTYHEREMLAAEATRKAVSEFGFSGDGTLEDYWKEQTEEAWVEVQKERKAEGLDTPYSMTLHPRDRQIYFKELDQIRINNQLFKLLHETASKYKKETDARAKREFDRHADHLRALRVRALEACQDPDAFLADPGKGLTIVQDPDFYKLAASPEELAKIHPLSLTECALDVYKIMLGVLSRREGMSSWRMTLLWSDRYRTHIKEEDEEYSPSYSRVPYTGGTPLVDQTMPQVAVPHLPEPQIANPVMPQIAPPQPSEESEEEETYVPPQAYEQDENYDTPSESGGCKYNDSSEVWGCKVK